MALEITEWLDHPPIPEDWPLISGNHRGRVARYRFAGKQGCDYVFVDIDDNRRELFSRRVSGSVAGHYYLRRGNFDYEHLGEADPDDSPKMAARIARFVKNGAPKYIHCYDNGGETADRYTIVFTGRYRNKTGGVFWHIGMSGNPFFPLGVCMHGESEHTQIDWPTYGHLGTKIKFHDLPPDCQKVIIHDYAYLWDLDKTNFRKAIKEQ